MRRRRIWWLVALACAAFLVEVVATTGWWRWTQIVEVVANEPAEGARMLAEDPMMALPSTVWWTRHLEVRDLTEAPREDIVEALDRVGTLQKRWMPSDPDGPTNLARAGLLSNRIEIAVSHLEDALIRDPMSPYLHRLMALVLRQTGHLDQFMDHLAQAEAIQRGFRSPPVELTPEDEQWVRLEGLRRRLTIYHRQRVYALIELSRELRRTGEESEALLVLAPVEQRPEVRLELAEWALGDGRFEDALALAQEVADRGHLPLKMRSKAWSLLSRASDMAGDDETALAAAHEALRLNPKSPAPYLALAAVAERRGELETALQHLRRAWGVAPTDVRLLLRLSSVAERTGHQGDARLALERAAEVAKDDPRITAKLVDYYLRNGDFMAAAMRLSRALERFPTDPTLLRLAHKLSSDVSR